MKFLKLCTCVLALASTFTHAQAQPRQVTVVNAFGAINSLQPNLAFEKFSKSLRSLPAGVGFDLRPSAAMPSSFAFDSVSSGKIQMMWAQSAYFSSKEFAFTLLTYPPFITAERYLQWRSLPDTVRSVDSLYSKYRLKAIPCSVVDSNMDFVLRATPEGESPYRGARIVMVGPLQEIYAASGIVPLAIPIAEVARSMQTGTIDGAYAYSPYDSIELRLYESTKALIFPSKVRSFFSIDLLVNLEFWTGLPESDRSAIEGVCRNLTAETLVSSRKLADDAVERYKQTGVIVMPLPHTETEAMRLKWEEIAAKRAVFEPVFDQLFKSLYGK